MNENNWFTIDQIDNATYAVSEYAHWEETHCYLIIGSQRALLIDSGLGVGNIKKVIQSLTDKPVAAVATHIHWDHIGGHKYFPEFYAHRAESEWLNGSFPLPVQAIRGMISDGCILPPSFDINGYEIFQGHPFRYLEDGDTIDLGGRHLCVFHTPGHSPGHMCFWEPQRGYLFTGDLVYKGTLFANYPSTDPELYLASMVKLTGLEVKHLFPGHHTMDIQPEIIGRIREALIKLDADGKLHHGSGSFDFGDWSIQL